MSNINPLNYTGTITGNTKRAGCAQFSPTWFDVSEKGIVSLKGIFPSITSIAAPAGSNLTIKMGDAAGANKLSFTDSTNTEVGSMDSNGTFISPLVKAAAFDTNVLAAGVTLQGTTLAANGTDGNIDVNIIPKGAGTVSVTGSVSISAGKQLRLKGGAVTDFVGQATLVAGEATVLNTNVVAGDKVLVSRRDVNSSTALGVFDVTVTGATSFKITSRKADATIETNDVSIVDYYIVRQI